MRLWDLKRKASSGVVVLSMLLGTSAALCAADLPNANDGAKSTGRIVILGDSITAGYGLDDPDAAYPAVLQKKIAAAGLPYTVVNAGVSGDTTAGGLRRIKWALGQGAEVLVVALGGNDGLRGIQPKQTEENLTGIIKEARAKSPNITVLIAGMQMPTNMGPDFVEQFRAVFPKVAKEQSVGLIPFLIEGVGGDPKFNQPDQIHPTAEGQQRVAENVWKLLQPALKKPAAEAPRS